MKNKPTYEELEKQLAELAGREQEKIEQLIKNSFDMIILLDSNGIQHFVSESCERILGYKPEELINIPVIEQMVHPEDQEKTRAGLMNILNRSAHGGTQYRHRHKNGGWVYLEAFGSNQIDNPLIKSVILNVRDITDRKKAEQALQESETRLNELNATKDHFFSIIGHDLKTPFNGILGISNLMVEKIKANDFEELEEYATLIQDASQTAVDLLDNLLNWAQTQTGRIQFKPKKVDFVSLVKNVVKLLDESARQKSITIHQRVSGNTFVQADQAMIQTILRNLIGNSIKFTPHGGEISIQTDQKEKEFIVTVADNGVGIEKEDLGKLFILHSRYSKLGTNEEAGTGLGLLICKEFVEMHGGRIWVDSKRNKGSKFSFSIPQD